MTKSCMTLRALNYGNYGIFLIMGNTGFCPSTVDCQIRHTPALFPIRVLTCTWKPDARQKAALVTYATKSLWLDSFLIPQQQAWGFETSSFLDRSGSRFVSRCSLGAVDPYRQGLIRDALCMRIGCLQSSPAGIFPRQSCRYLFSQTLCPAAHRTRL